jgi:hypothetical protein
MVSKHRGKLIAFIALCWILFFLHRSLVMAHSTFYELLVTSAPPFTDFLPRVDLRANTSTNTNDALLRFMRTSRFSACLLVMDENFRLYEWLAYAGYHVLTLRYVVIAVDPGSVLSPEPVLDLFRNELNMTIITWADSDFVNWEPLPPDTPPEVLTNRYLMRQRKFLGKCMKF